MRAERISKSAVAAWAVLAVFVEFYYASPGWAGLRLFGPLVLASAVLASWFDRRTVAVVALAPYLFPIILYWTVGAYHVHYSIAWLAAMLGVVLRDALARPWHAPGRWGAALACWAGVIAITAPIIVLRSIDLRWELLTRSRLPHEALGGLTYQSLGWIGHVSLLLVIGILWFDWLCSLDAPFFERWIALPLFAGAVGMALVSGYQMLFDIKAVNPTVYARLLRATGTLFDANVTGAAASLWIGGSVLVGLRMLGRRWAFALAAVPLFWLATWGSGSRTAFLAGLLVSLCAAYAVVKHMGLKPRTMVVSGIVTLALLGGGLTLLARTPRIAGPLVRFRAMALRGQTKSPEAFFLAMWNRDGYGLAANRMIARYPAVGVGVGAFHEMAPEFAGALPADNAQNWFRHQLAETGVIGSLGWIAFLGAFGWWVLRPRGPVPPAAWVLRGILVIFAVMSLVSMPGQDPAVAVTLLTLMAWYLLVVGRPAPTTVTPMWGWGLVLLVVLVAGAGTARLAAGSLRLPVRIQHSASSDFSEYSYGFWPVETDDEGEFRWTGREATAVVPATGRQLTLTAGVNFGDLAAHQTQAKVWVDGRLVIDGRLTADAPTLTQSINLSDPLPRVLVETWTDRTETAPPPDGRELGLMVRWRFSGPGF